MQLFHLQFKTLEYKDALHAPMNILNMNF